MDVMQPTDPVERLIRTMALDSTSSLATFLRNPTNQSLMMSIAGLISFSLLALQFFAPLAYASVSAFHIAVRTGLCIALCAYVYQQLKPACKTAATAPARAAATATNPEAVPSGESPLPDFLLRDRTYIGSTAQYSLVPVPAVHRPHNLIYAALNQPRMIEGAWNFIKKKASAAVTTTVGSVSTGSGGVAPALEYPEVVSVYQLGDKVSGHRNIVHGGLTAALLDQTLGIASFVSLPPNRTSFTANLNINYRKPVPANTSVLVRCATTKIDGRKVYVNGRVESFADSNTLYAEATALFVMPK